LNVTALMPKQLEVGADVHVCPMSEVCRVVHCTFEASLDLYFMNLCTRLVTGYMHYMIIVNFRFCS